LSYNAMPGRAADLPFQRLVRALGQTCVGDSTEQVSLALNMVDTFLALKASALMSSPMLSSIKQRRDRFAVSYLAHEFMGQHWDPLFVTDVRSNMATIGLEPVGSATFVENHDSFVLGRAAREALKDIEDDEVRELARDFLIDQCFRRDVFVREGNDMNDDEQRQRLLASTFALTRVDTNIEYTIRTAAGDLTFDNSAARAIIDALGSGPCRLGVIAEQRGVGETDIIANAMALCASYQIRPVEGARASVAAMNAVIARRLGGPEEILYLALPCGTAIGIDDSLRALLRGETGSGDDFDDARRFLTRHSI